MSKRVQSLTKTIIKLYLVHNKSPTKIASHCCVSVSTVYYTLKQAGIKLRGKQVKPNKEVKLKEEKYETPSLHFWYVTMNLTVKELAFLYDTSKRNMEKILQRRRIKKRR